MNNAGVGCAFTAQCGEPSTIVAGKLAIYTYENPFMPQARKTLRAWSKRSSRLGCFVAALLAMTNKGTSRRRIFREECLPLRCPSHMHRIVIIAAVCSVLSCLEGCANASSRLRARPAAAAALDPVTREKIEQGVIEPGFTSEMVFLALGRPTTPLGADIDQTREGVWKYSNQYRNERDFIRSGFRQRKVFDPDRRSDVIITEPVDDRSFPSLRDYTLEIEFRDGRVTSVRRVEL
jgi:hypothetical protein